MRTLTLFIVLSIAFSLVSTRKSSPPRILLLTGGCWHNYANHEQSLRNAFRRARIDVDWTVVKLECRFPEPAGELPMIRRPRWSAPYDLVMVNGCYHASRRGYLNEFMSGFQRGTPLVALHCAVHSFAKSASNVRWKWRELLGVTSSLHENRRPVRVRLNDHNSNIMYPLRRAGGAHWMRNEELYVVDRIWPSTHILAYARSTKTRKRYPVFWTNWYRGRTRVFATSIGHSDVSYYDKVFTDTIVRGALWALGRLRW